MHSFFQVLSTPTADTPGTTLLLHFDDRRYIFGQVAEGTQRTINELGIRFSKLSDIFLTGKVDWSTAGGLIGLVITITDIPRGVPEGTKARKPALAKKLQTEQGEEAAGGGSERLTVHGGRNLQYLLSTARGFIFRRKALIDVNEFEDLTGQDTLDPPETGKSCSSLEGRDGTENDGGSPPQPPSPWQPTWSDGYIKVWVMGIKSQGAEPSSSTGNRNRRRKRTFAEHESDSTSSGSDRTKTSFSGPRPHRDDQARAGVLSEMSNSNWNFGTFEQRHPSTVGPNDQLFTQDEQTGQFKPLGGSPPHGGSTGDTGPSVASPSNANIYARARWPGARADSPPRATTSRQSICYIVKNQGQRGRFLPDRAIALKVKRGPNFRWLANGKSVVAEDGTKVTPEMVMAEPELGKGVAIVDLPEISYVEDLIGRREWHSEEVMEGVSAIIWILGPGVCQHPDLLQFVRRMSHLSHLVSSPDHCSNYLAFESAASAAIKLHRISDAHFPIPVHSNIRPRQATGSWRHAEAPQVAERGMRLQLAPSFSIVRDSVTPVVNTLMSWLITSPLALDLAERGRWLLRSATKGLEVERHQRQSQSNLPSQDAEIVTLGTGSMQPSKYRNVSSILLRVPGYGNYLFDCGENTLGQLRRVFTPKELLDVFRDLKAIWISHLHADHHLGTASVIRAWRDATDDDNNNNSNEARTNVNRRSSAERASVPSAESAAGRRKPLYVMSDNVMLRWIKDYSQVEDIGYDRLRLWAVRGANASNQLGQTMLYEGRVALPRSTSSEKLDNETISPLGLADIQAVYVDHCYGAMAVSYTFPNGFKFSYSGDCRPSKAFADIGRDSTVLVHEATFDDELSADAAEKKHCTTSEALGVAVAMRAKTVILTHFSQRYPKIPVLDTIGHGRSSSATGRTLRGDTAEGTHPKSLRNATDEDGDRPTSSSRAQTNDQQRRRLSNDGLGRSVPASDRLVTAADQAGQDTVDDEVARDLKVGVAFDYMRVKVGEIGNLRHLNPALQKLFEDEEMRKETEKAARRAANNDSIVSRAKSTSKHKPDKTNKVTIDNDT